jgi:flavin-dependent dehydrogenase
MRAVGVEFRSDDEVVVEGRNGSGETRSWTARFLVDASGRDGFLANKFDWRVKDPHHRSAAVFAHYDNVVRREGEEEGNISVYWFEHGWFWLIPLRDGRMSVGAVCRPDYLKSRKGTVDVLLADAIALCPPLVARMRDATIASEVIATGNFSYESKRMFARNYVLIGDAYAFIDPVFSTGVFLAMASARSAADVIDKSLDNPGVRERLLARHQREVRRWLKAYSWFIYRFTSPAMKQLVMTRNNPWGLKSAVISLLTGDTKREPRRVIRLGMFKGFYYLFSAMAWRQSRQWHREVRRSA